jgi:hypothetical protein
LLIPSDYIIIDRRVNGALEKDCGRRSKMVVSVGNQIPEVCDCRNHL